MGNNTSNNAAAPNPAAAPPLSVPMPENLPPVQPPPAQPATQPQGPDFATLQQEVAASQQTDRSGNPGAYEEIHKKTKDLFPQVFEGGKLMISKGMSSQFQATHSLVLANPMTSGYRFGASYVGSKQFSPQEQYPVMLGDIDASGNLNATIVHGFTRNLITKCVAQFQGEKMNSQLSADYKGSSYTASVITANPDLLNGTGVVIGHYLQRITPSFDMGAECMYQCGGHVPGGQIAVMSLAARINGAKQTLSANLSPMGPTGLGLHLAYHHRISDHLQVGAELETATGMGEAVATVGYQQEVPAAGVMFRGSVDSNLTVQATLEKKMFESLPITFTLSAVGNSTKSDYKFGVGMMIG